MGVAQLPRLYFKGSFYWNPSTFNNNDYDPPIDTYDASDASLNWEYLHGQGVYDPREFRKWSITPIQANEPHLKVPPTEWNYYGGNQCGFVTDDAPSTGNPLFSKPQDYGPTKVTGWTDAAGAYSAKDPWIGEAMQFNLGSGSAAKLVDINPSAYWTSQVFADSFTLGSAESGLAAPCDYRMYSRWPNLSHSYNASGDLGLPTAAVERIEIVRGPLSAFYGSTGLAGAIHVVTRRGEAGHGRGEVEAEAGDARARGLSGSVSGGGDYPEGSGGPRLGSGELRQAQNREASLGLIGFPGPGRSLRLGLRYSTP